MTYTEKLLSKADEEIPRVTLDDFKNDPNAKVMIDVRQHEELQASGTVKGSMHIPKGVIEFRLNNNDEISFDELAELITDYKRQIENEEAIREVELRGKVEVALESLMALARAAI